MWGIVALEGHKADGEVARTVNDKLPAKRINSFSLAVMGECTDGVRHRRRRSDGQSKFLPYQGLSSY